MKYYIYHIPGIKIGCTNQLEIRMRDQGFTEWEILESYRNIYTASKREIELQKEYKLPIDAIPYWKTIKNNSKGGWSQNAWDACSKANKGRIPAHVKTKKHQTKAAKLGAASTNSIRKQCAICGYESTPAGIAMHNKKCN